MFGSDKFSPVIETLDLLRAERQAIKFGRLPFRIIHRFRTPRTDCMAGEEVLASLLLHRGREYQLPLSPALLLLADYLLRNSRYSQTASQIATGIHASDFYSEHGSNGRRQRIRRIPRSAIREYIKRLRRALALVFSEEMLRIDPRDVLVAEESVSNHLLYRWRAVVEVTHVDSTSANVQPIWGGISECPRRWR
jgi:hypothetical protein